MQRIIIDTDAGIDDALAILLALAWPDVEIQAITTVHGNVPVETATQNVVEILSVAGRRGIVSRGCAAPLAGAPVFAGEVHGHDGLGGWSKTAPGSPLQVNDLAAPQLIPSLARRFPGEITLIALGPLTNLATAARVDAEGLGMLKELVIMGGTIWEPGNVTPVAEFNFFADPEAAREVVRCAIPSVLVGLDVTRHAVLRRQRLEQSLAGRCDRRARFLDCICSHLFSFYRTRLGGEMCYLHDPLAVGVALDRSLAETRPMNVDIETSGELTRGMVVAERRPWAHQPANAAVCVKADSERFLAVFCERVLTAGGTMAATGGHGERQGL